MLSDQVCLVVMDSLFFIHSAILNLFFIHSGILRQLQYKSPVSLTTFHLLKNF